MSHLRQSHATLTRDKGSRVEAVHVVIKMIVTITILSSQYCSQPISVLTTMKISYCMRALVFRVGSSGRKFRYSSTSFSMASSCDCSLLRRLGRVLRMWFVSCWLRTRCRYGVPIRSTRCLHTHTATLSWLPWIRWCHQLSLRICGDHRGSTFCKPMPPLTKNQQC